MHGITVSYSCAYIFYKRSCSVFCQGGFKYLQLLHAYIHMLLNPKYICSNVIYTIYESLLMMQYMMNKLVSDVLLFSSYFLWERVVGGQVQGSLCDVSTNPVLLFTMDGATELVTMPLNLTDVRYV